MDRYIGKMLDNRYEILECVGTGGMAVVYKARCHRLNRLVAVKILKPELAKDADFRRRFHDESQAVAMLSHANIVSVYDVSHSDGLDYIVMELIDGMTLKQYMKKRGTPLNWREALHFITQIVRALGHAHSRGIIHRDIKPHNIMVLRDGSVKVADFGIARLASAAQATLTQEALGSVHYISPEQAKGSQVDGRSDLYSVGVVLYEMLTGRLPFEGDTPVFVAIQHINSIPLAPRELNPEIPVALEAITMKAMAPNADNRYSSADEMLADLKEFRKNPGMPIPVPVKKEAPEDEVEEPTRVIPVSGMKKAGDILPEKKPAGKPVPEKKQPQQKPERQSVQNRTRAAEMPVKEEDDEESSGEKRRIWPALVAVGVILLFLCGVVYFLYSFLIKGLFAETKEYRVPNLMGYTITQLEANPTVLGDFTIVVDRTVYSEEYDEGQICEQSPAANEYVKEGNLVITVTLSGGEDSLFMRNVESMDARQALHILQDEMGLVVDQEKEHSDVIEAGYIISYTPIEGTLLQPGDTVTIVISKGPEIETVKVPDFVGENIEQVKTQMELLKLDVYEVKEVHSDEYPAGDVIWQSIEPEERVEEGTDISFQVSLGPERDPDPFFSEDIPIPSNSPSVSTSTQTIQVDLSDYTGSVRLNITVGNTVIYDGNVDSSVGVFERSVTGSGVQVYVIYVNGTLVEAGELEF